MPPIYKSEIVRGWAHDVSIGYRNARYIATHPYPVKQFNSPKVKVFVYNKGDQFRSQAVLRAPGAASRMRHRKGSSVNVDTNQYGISEQITDEDLATRNLPEGATPPIDLTGDATRSNADQHDLRQEIAVSASITGATWAGGNNDVAGLWEPLGATNTFVADLMTGLAALEALGHFGPFGLLIDGKTWRPLSQSDDLVDRIKHTGRDSITTTLLANLFDLQEVVIGKAMKNTADEKADGTDGTFKQIWEKNEDKGMAFLYVIPPGVSGKQIVVPGLQAKSKMLMNGGRVSEQWYEKREHAWTVETREDIGLKIIDLSAGYLFEDTFAT